ncbi:MAG: redox-sensing transcriptional repressor Rex [Planctomycetota bacterium]
MPIEENPPVHGGKIPHRTIGRLSLYRRQLGRMGGPDGTHVYSHQIADICGVTPEQVRRDLMVIGCSGSPNRGYPVAELVSDITAVLDGPEMQRVALVGIGNLGRALLAYFTGRHPKMSIVAAFDSDPEKADRIIHGCRCHPVQRMEEIVRAERIAVGVVAVPAAAAQGIADRLVAAGVRGLLNFAPVALRVPNSVFVEDIDVTTSLEKVAYFARAGKPATA